MRTGSRIANQASCSQKLQRADQVKEEGNVLVYHAKGYESTIPRYTFAMCSSPPGAGQSHPISSGIEDAEPTYYNY